MGRHPFVEPELSSSHNQIYPQKLVKIQTFEWQEGYGAFSIGVSGIEATTKYIANQAEHHRKKTFKSELSTILKKHGLQYEEWMLD
jgi:putative transposase